MRVVRRAARAILIDEAGRLILFKRTVPKRKVYWSTPGGGVDEEDGSIEAALHRELFEELGAVVDRAQQVFITSPPRGDGIAVQHFFVCRLVSMNIRKRTGTEFSNPAKGRYDVERFDLRAKKPKLARINLQPREARDFILANRAALLGAVLDDRMPALTEPQPVPEPVIVEVVRTVPVPAGLVNPEPANSAHGETTASPSEQSSPDQSWSDADDAAAREDRETLVPVGVGADGRQPAHKTSRVSAPTPLGAGPRATQTAPSAVDVVVADGERTAPADTDKPASSHDANDLVNGRRPWYRRVFRRT
jgi:8-oxo-dGTP pyrophosphatase MutT (NUDIX family)